ncbi:MAG: glycerol-3-phosphate dehydrogenase [Alphaproteobacteria bacterium]
MHERYDLAVIGGGINGTGIARDAAGRGLKVLLTEKGDLGGATSAASTKLIHGGLRYLEHYEFRLVREALIEREVLLKAAPHIVWPLRFVLPHHQGLRPAWMIRLGLFLYDHLGGRKLLPGTETVDLRRDPAGAILRDEFARAFVYSDCWVEDARLVVLNAMDAAERGADIRVRTAVTGARREDGAWTVDLESGDSVRAHALVNAAGPWVHQVLTGALGRNSPAKVRLVKGSHIVVPRPTDHDRAYIFQHGDGRVIFLIPYEHDFSLIGTTDEDYRGDPAEVAATPGEIDYLCGAVSAYLKTPVRPTDVVWTYAGVRPLYDDGASKAQEATREYVLTLDGERDEPRLLNVFGGKITTYRRLAEAALAELAPHLPKLGAPWTEQATLPGGDFRPDGFVELAGELSRSHAFLDAGQAHRLTRAYGTRARALLDGATSIADMGEDFGAGLSEREVRYLIDREWARTAADVLWRRSKLGLRLDQAQAKKLDAWMRGAVGGDT